MAKLPPMISIALQQVLEFNKYYIPRLMRKKFLLFSGMLLRDSSNKLTDKEKIFLYHLEKSLRTSEYLKKKNRIQFIKLLERGVPDEPIEQKFASLSLGEDFRIESVILFGEMHPELRDVLAEIGIYKLYGKENTKWPIFGEPNISDFEVTFKEKWEKQRYTRPITFKLKIF